MFEKVRLNFDDFTVSDEEFLELQVNEHISLRINKEAHHFKLEVVGLEHTETHSEKETLKLAIKFIHDLIKVAKEKGIEEAITLMEII